MRVQTALQRTRQKRRAAERDAPCTAPSRRLQPSKSASPAPSLAQWPLDVHGFVGSVLTAGDRHRAGHLLAGARVNCLWQFNITGRYAKLLRNRWRALRVRITPVMSCALAPAALSLRGLLFMRGQLRYPHTPGLVRSWLRHHRACLIAPPTRAGQPVRGRAAARHSFPAPSARPPIRPGGAPIHRVGGVVEAPAVCYRS